MLMGGQTEARTDRRTDGLTDDLNIMTLLHFAGEGIK